MPLLCMEPQQRHTERFAYLSLGFPVDRKARTN